MNKVLKFIFVFVLILFVNQLKSQCLSDFSFTQNLCFSDSVSFSFSGSGDSVKWNFGDAFSGPNNTDTNRIVKHQFTDTGFYTVQCIAVTGACRDTILKTVYIAQKAKADFTFKDACFGLTTQFNSSSFYSYRDSISQFYWDFGDSTNSSIDSTLHTYTSSGFKTVCLQITTVLGCKDTLKKAIKIKDNLSYSANVDSVCLGGKVNFSSNAGSDIPNEWLWQFGDGNVSNIPLPEYTYSQIGMQYFTLALTYADSSVCTIANDSLFVLELPNASFTYSSDTIQCFKGNEVCIKFDSLNQNIQFRNILWDDGSTSNVPITDSVFCHSYINPLGSSYKVTLEVIDGNWCAIRQKDSTNVIILRDPIADFDFALSGGCFKSVLDLNNLSNMVPPTIEKFTWVFGDGDIDTSNWLNPSHTYTSNGNFNVSLFIKDTFGCVDSFTSNSPISNISYVVDAKVDSVLDYCRLNNRFEFKQTAITGAAITWYFGDNDSSTVFNPSKHYLNIGEYLPSVKISKQGCDSSIALDTIIVYGPYANASIQNQYQCQIKDTVYFTNVSATFRNKHIQSFWSVNDFVAANCTTDTKNGLNVNSNCNFSKDSLKFKHMFTPGNEQCYGGFLIQTDTVVGCSDSFPLAIPLMRPNADSGLRVFFQSQSCVGPESPKEVFIGLGLTQPNCGRESYYIMWDSLCAEESGNFNSHWRLNQDRHNYGYNNLPCNSNGYVTLGLILQNGLDSFGNVCRDTGFYHHIIKFGLLDPRIASSYNPDSLYCSYSSHEFFIADSIQDSIDLIIWDFGDGTIDTANGLGKISHTYAAAGVYRVTSYIQHLNGCDGIDTFQVRIGVEHSTSLGSDYLCLGDSIVLQSTSNYWFGGNPNYFSNNNRASLGKERTRWDLDDGLGFKDSGQSIYLNYNRIGNYTIRMELRDSLGCLDTSTLQFPFRVFDISSKIDVPGDTLVCPQVVQLFSASTVYDSLNNFGHSDDSVQLFIWTFGDGSGSSLQANPSKFFDKGTQALKLYAENTRGCKDSIVDSFFIVTPTARFIPITDSLGCQPHQMSFSNISVDANDFTWKFNNPGNNILNSSNTNDVNFNYANYGTFYPEMIARMNALNNGIPITCADTFPNIARGDSAVSITVFEKPVARFTHITDCSINTTTFNNTTTINTDTVTSYLWTFGDGDSSSLENPIHQYVDTGSYIVTLRIWVGKGCADSFSRLIFISPIPFANFIAADVCEEETMQFADVSNAYNDIIYLWSWDFGDGNTSMMQNPQHLFDQDSSYQVMLHVTNRAGCFDTITKTVKVNSKPAVDFTFLNACHEKANNFYGVASVKGSSLSYQWNFGDDSSSKSKNPIHFYNDTGNYEAKFIAISLFGCKDSVTKEVRVYPNPTSNFDINSTIQCLNQNQYSFTNTSFVPVDTIRNTYWYSSDGGSNFSQNYNKVFLAKDSFKITLVSLTNNNCRDTIVKWVEVLESPKALPLISNLSMCVNGDSIRFVDTFVSVNPLMTRQWVFDNVVVGSDSALAYKFITEGQKKIELFKTLSNGCSDTFSTQINIHPKPTAYILINEDEQCFGANSFRFSDSSYINAPISLSRKWDLGNGDSSIASNFLYNYATSDTFKVSLISQSGQNCFDTAFRSVLVHPEPFVDFSIDTPGLCLRSNIFNCSNSSSVPGTTLAYNWDFNNGEWQSSLINPSYSFIDYGAKAIKLLATSLFGCKDSILKSIEVYPMPMARPVVNAASQCQDEQNFLFTDSSSIASGNLARTWIWDDLSKDTAIQYNRSFNKDITYWHTLISTSDKSCADTARIENTVNPVPQAKFAINDTGQCVNAQYFNFENSSIVKDGMFISYWDYDDGGKDTVLENSHYFNSANGYNIQLIIESIQQCRDTALLALEVYPKPNALLAVNDSAQCFTTQNFIFTGNSSISSGSLIRFEWDTFNQPFYGSKDTFLRFPVEGNYTVKYVVESNKNCFDTTQQLIVVHPNPRPAFTILDSIQCENDNIFSFTSTSSIPQGSLVDSWYSDYQFFSALKSANKQYFAQDTHRITLVNTSDKGCLDSAVKPIFVVLAPHTRFSVNDSGQCLLGNSFAFTNSSSIEDGGLTYDWSFGDGANSLLTDPSHVYTNHGDFVTQLISSSIYNCKDTLFVPVLVHPDPLASYLVNDPSQCLLNNSFNYSNTSTIDSTSISTTWYFGDGNTSSLVSPNHSYSNYGSFQNRMLVSSIYGCLDSQLWEVVVNPMANVDFTINDSTQCINVQDYQFRSISSIALGTIEQTTWNTEGQTFINTNSLNHRYSSSGIFNVELEAVSDSACKASKTKSVRVYPKPIAQPIVNDSVQCLRGNNYLYRDVSFDSFGIIGHKWFYQNVLEGVADTFSKVYQTPGNKALDLVTTSANLCEDTSRIWVRVKRMPDPAFERLKPYYCEDELPISLTANEVGGSFYGKNILSQQYVPRKLWDDTVTYVIEVEGCIDSSKQFTDVYPLPVAFLGDDTTICKHETILLGANSWNSSFVWNNGITDSAFRAVKAGKYWVTATNVCGTDSDTIEIAIRDINCRFFLPTAFTPNNNTINDRYKPVTYDVDEMTFEIYNRWGGKVYEGNVTDPGWEGTYLGKNSPEGWYVIVVNYSYQTEVRKVIEQAHEVFYLFR